jgi:hypothetical protein
MGLTLLPLDIFDGDHAAITALVNEKLRIDAVVGDHEWPPKLQRDLSFDAGIVSTIQRCTELLGAGSDTPRPPAPIFDPEIMNRVP